MALFENFPYTNFHEMNMDWLLKKVKELSAQVTEFETLLENGPILDVKTQVNGTYTTIRDSDGNALLPKASDTTAGVVTMDVDGDTVTLGGASTVEVPVLTNGVLSADQIPSDALASATNAGSVLLNADPGVDGVAKIVGADGEISFPKLTDNKLDESLLPDSGITAGTYGASSLSTTAGIYTGIIGLDIDEAGRITHVYTDAATPHWRWAKLSIAAGSTTGTIYFDTTNFPWYNTVYWIDVDLYELVDSTQMRKLEDSEYVVDWYNTSTQKYLRVTLNSTHSNLVYVYYHGIFGSGGK